MFYACMSWSVCKSILNSIPHLSHVQQPLNVMGNAMLTLNVIYMTTFCVVLLLAHESSETDPLLVQPTSMFYIL